MRDLRTIPVRHDPGLCNIAPAVITAGASILGSLLGSSAQKKAAKDNVQLAREQAAQTERLIRENWGRNDSLALANKAENAALFTGARDEAARYLTEGSDTAGGLLRDYRDYAFDIFGKAQGANEAQINNTFLANQAALDGTTRAIQDFTAQARDKNTALYTQAGEKNEADIRAYAERAAAAIEGARSANEALFMPFVSNGRSASDAINALLGLSGDASAQSEAFKRWSDSTGYQYALDSGRKSVETSHAAEGMLESGATLKALQDRGQQVGQSYFGNYLSALQGQAGLGASAAGSLGASNTAAAGQGSSLWQNTSGQLTDNRTGIANALAGVNNNFLAASTANLRNYADGTIGNSDALLANSMGNRDRYTAAYADLYGKTNSGLADLATGTASSLANLGVNTASSLAGLNTSTTNNLIAGNNAATGGLMTNSSGLTSVLSNSNTARGNATANLFGGIAGSLGAVFEKWPPGQDGKMEQMPEPRPRVDSPALFPRPHFPRSTARIQFT